MTERNPEPNWLEVVSMALGSDDFQLAFSGASPDERIDFINGLGRSQSSLRRVHNRLKQAERTSAIVALAQKLGIDKFRNYDLHYRPYLVVRDLLRKGKHLDFSSLDDETMALYPEAVRGTINAYKTEIDRFGTESIAHLCPTRPDLADLQK